MMKYEGKLYGKIRRKYFLLTETAKDVDNLRKENEKLKALIKELENCCPAKMPCNNFMEVYK